VFKRQGFMDRLRPRDPLLEADLPYVFESDTRPVADHPRRFENDPEAERRLKLRRRAFAVLLVALVSVGSAAALFGEGGLRDRLRLSAEHRQLLAEIESRRAATARLREQVDGLLHDPMASERIAREQLGFVRPGEVVYLLPRDASASDPTAPDPGPRGTRPERR